MIATAVGKGGALFLGGCKRDFDGVEPCGVNASTFMLNYAANAGGTVHVGNVDGPSYAEFNDCVVANSTAGELDVEVDEGEGGAFSVDQGSTLVLVNTTVRGCAAARKVCAPWGVGIAYLLFIMLQYITVSTRSR